MEMRSTLVYKQLLIWFIIGILLGTFCSVFCIDSLFSTLLQYLPQLYLELNRDGVWLQRLGRLCRLRIPVFLLLTVLISSGFWLIVYRFLTVLAGIRLSILVIMVTVLRGIPGILFAVMLLLPHGLLYLMVYWTMLELTVRRSLFSLSEKMQMTGKMMLVWLAAIVTEAFISPVSLRFLLRFMPELLYR